MSDSFPILPHIRGCAVVVFVNNSEQFLETFPSSSSSSILHILPHQFSRTVQYARELLLGGNSILIENLKLGGETENKQPQSRALGMIVVR